MNNKSKIRQIFFLFSILPILIIGKFEVAAIALILFGAPSIALSIWLAGKYSHLVCSEKLLISGISGAAISLSSLAIGVPFLFILMAFENLDALGGAILALLLSLVIAGIPVGILGALSALTCRFVCKQKT